MKIEFKNRTNEEMQELEKSLVVGQELIKFHYNNWFCRWEWYGVRVKNITPKGRIRLDNGELLDYLPSNYYRVDDEEALKLIQQMRFNITTKKLIEDTRDSINVFLGRVSVEDQKALNEILLKYRNDMERI